MANDTRTTGKLSPPFYFTSADTCFSLVLHRFPSPWQGTDTLTAPEVTRGSQPERIFHGFWWKILESDWPAVSQSTTRGQSRALGVQHPHQQVWREVCAQLDPQCLVSLPHATALPSLPSTHNPVTLRAMDSQGQKPLFYMFIIFF